MARKAEECDGIQSALALRREQSVLLFVHVENSVNVQTDLCKKLDVGLPLVVILVDNWPVTRNGWYTVKYFIALHSFRKKR